MILEILMVLRVALANWRYVVQFAAILDQAFKNGYNAMDLKRSMDRLQRGFNDAKTIQDSANSAESINDAFRK